MWKRAALAGMAIVIAAVAWFGLFFFRDNFSTHYPVKVISAASFRAGEIPYWNFYDGGGQPLAGNPNTLTFYPDNFLYLILPAHVAFNLHFLLHFVAAWFAMRALARSPYAAWLYVLSGLAMSACAFYNLIVAVAVVPFAFWAAERRRILFLGAAFGLLALAGEPVAIIGAAIGVAILWPSWRLIAAAALSLVIALPQLIAYSEIAREVERARGFSAQTVLSASLDPRRIVEMLIGPLFRIEQPHLFLSIFVGIVLIPAVLQRSRYVAIAATSLFLALGRFNPIVAAAVEALPRLRIVRYPEKFAIPMIAAIVVLTARPLSKRLWQIVTFVPILIAMALTVPIDWFGPYDAPPMKPARLFVARSAGGQGLSRADYRRRARALEPAFGAVAGIRYALDRSPEGMFSVMTRVAAERLQSTGNVRWLRIAGCQNTPQPLPRAFFAPTIIGAASVPEAVRLVESVYVQRVVVGPPRLHGFISPSQARVVSIGERPQSLAISVTTPAPAVLFVNETYFAAWDAGGLETFRLDLDRTGIMVPAGARTITLRCGRHRTAVAVSWAISLLLLACCAFAMRIKVLDGSASEVERAADEDRPSALA